MALLVQFLLRLTFGLAFGMLITSPKLVTSGYFRNHLYVTLGLSALAGLLSYSLAPEAFWFAVVAAGCSYLGAVYWLFEKSGPGRLMLLIIVIVGWVGASVQVAHLDAQRPNVLGTTVEQHESPDGEVLEVELPSQYLWMAAIYPSCLHASVFSSGLVLGLTMAAMLLGHWYLNSPTMELVPLRKLILAMGSAVMLQAVLSAWGLWTEVALTSVSLQWILFVALRWTFGIIGVAAMTWMAWQTLKIPNTQSATGILYVAVIGTFVGETMALLLSTESVFPL